MKSDRESVRERESERVQVSRIAVCALPKSVAYFRAAAENRFEFQLKFTAQSRTLFPSFASSPCNLESYFKHIFVLYSKQQKNPLYFMQICGLNIARTNTFSFFSLCCCWFISHMPSTCYPLTTTERETEGERDRIGEREATF